jgi:hypothetical protein
MCCDCYPSLSLYRVVNNSKKIRAAVIKANPDKSKHLETTTFVLNGIDLDLCNLRTEEYAADSRIPKMSMGTVLQDAARRDFTVNALFFNLDTMQVEDVLEGQQGLRDLRNRVLRTPMAPMVTLCDDPLRTIRAARFAGRYNLQISEDIEQAAVQEVVHECMRTKLSRGRIGEELAKMLKYAQTDPVKLLRAFQIMTRWNLMPIVCDTPPADTVLPNTGLLEGIEAGAAALCAQSQSATGQMDCTPEHKLGTNEQQAIPYQLCVALLSKACDKLMARLASSSSSSYDTQTFLLSSFLIPFHLYQYAVKTKAYSVAQFVVMSWHKIRAQHATACVQAITNAFRLVFLSIKLWEQRKLLDPAARGIAAPVEEKTRALHDILEGPFDEDYLVIESGKLLTDMKKTYDVVVPLAEVLCEVCFPALLEQRVLSEYTAWLQDKERKDAVWGCLEWTPLLKGNELTKLCNIRGQRVGEVVRHMNEWRYTRPGVSKEEMTEWLRANFREELQSLA